MGVSIEVYRCHIGRFQFRQGALSRSVCCRNQCDIGVSFRHVPLAVVLALLLISGIESNPGPVFTCKVCSHSYASVLEYSEHVKIHQSTKRCIFMSIPCCWCGQHFKNISSFESHITRYHHDKRERKGSEANPILESSSPIFVHCPLCPDELQSRSDYLKHMAAHLRDGKSFKCPLSKCKQVQQHLPKFWSHTSRYHPVHSEAPTSSSAQEFQAAVASTSSAPDSAPNQFLFEAYSEDSFGDDTDTEGISSAENPSSQLQSQPASEVFPESLIKDEMGKFYLKLESSLMLPTNHVQEISQEVKLISELSHHSLRKAMIREMQEAGASYDQAVSIADKTFKCDPIYNIHHKHEDVEHLGTHHLRDKFWKKRFPFVIPEQVMVGIDDVGKKRYAHYVRIRNTISVLLKGDLVKHFVRESFTRQSECGVIKDYCDGSAFKQHMKQHSGGKCLQLMLFQDAFDVNAFTAAQGKFKPIGFYYSLGNLPPEYRSKVDLIQLVYIILEKDLKPSQQEELSDKDKLKCALKILFDELEDLKTNGIEFDGEIIPVCVLYLIGDSLGQHQIGGYVRSFSSEFFCRFCAISKREFKDKPWVTKSFRTIEEYNEAVRIAKRKWTFKRNEIVKRLSKTVKTLAAKRTERILARCSAPGMKKILKKNIKKTAYNKMCAVNFRGVKYRPSPFNSDKLNFHVSSPAMPPCLAHDFDGILKAVLPKILKHFIHKEWFDLDALNRRIKSFKCKGLDSADAPNPLKSEDKLNGNAVEILNLVRLLPLMIGDLIQDEDNEFWQLFLHLKDIIEFVCAPKITILQVGHLQLLINDYLRDIKELLPETLIPKHHFLAHYPELILLFGPLIRLFTLRFESKHMFFKEVVRSCKNFINITYTLAKKYMCRFAYDHSSEIISPVLVYNSSSSQKAYRNCLTENQIATFPKDFKFEETECVEWATFKGIKYQTQDVLVIGSDDGVHLNVGCIDKIIVAGEEKLLFLLEQRTAINSFNGYYHVKKNPASVQTHTLKHLDGLPDYYPLPLYDFCGKECISLKHSIICMVATN